MAVVVVDGPAVITWSALIALVAQPLLEGWAGKDGVGAREQRARFVEGVVWIVGIVNGLDPRRFAAVRGEKSCDVDEVLFARAGDLEDRRSVGGARRYRPALSG